MKRRNFLGFLGGAAVAGPGMVKHAAAETMADLSLPSIFSTAQAGAQNLGYIQGTQAGLNTPIDYLGSMKANIARIVGRSAAERAFHVQRTQVSALDPDLASYRSMSLGYRIQLQREREYERGINNQRSWLEAHIAGWFN